MTDLYRQKGAASMIWQRESEKAFPEIRDFYWRLIDDMASVNDRIGWKKESIPVTIFL